MKKFTIQVVALVLVAFGGIYISLNPNFMNLIAPIGSVPSQTQSQAQSKVKINETVLNIEIADNKTKREKGLGGRDGLASNSGMLFVFPQNQKQKFWMKGMKIPLDMIFIENGKIVDIIKSVPPPTSPVPPDNQLPIYQSVVSSNMVLEVNSGFVDTNNIKVGDMVYMIK